MIPFGTLRASPVARLAAMVALVAAASAVVTVPVRISSAQEANVIPLIEKLKSGDAAGKAEAAEGLGKAGQGALPAVPALVAALKDSDEKVKAAAKAALKEIAGKEVEKLTTTDSGLQYVDLAEGQGDSLRVGDQAVVHYTGWLTTGKKFDSSRDRGQPFAFPLGAGRVIKGWDEGVQSLKPGGRRLLVIPAKLAYGDRDVGGGLIPAGSTLVFDVEVPKGR